MSNQLEPIEDVKFFQPIDIKSDTDPLIIKKFISMIAFHLEEINNSARLCSMAGRRVVHVYSMKGKNLASVRNRLALFFDAMKGKTTLSIQERQFIQLIANRSREFEHDEMKNRSPSMPIDSATDVDALLNRIHDDVTTKLEYENRMHDKKECLCFCH